MTISYEELKDIQNQAEGSDPQPQDPYADTSTINAQLAQLGPDDHEELADLLRQNPDQQQSILYVAVRQCGNACVQRAMALLQSDPNATATPDDAPAAQDDQQEDVNDITDPEQLYKVAE